VFAYLLGEKENSETYYWLYGDIDIKPIEYVLERQLLPPPAKMWQIEDNWMTLNRDIAKKEYCEVAGRRMLVASYEPGGIFEVWAHPFMAFREFKVKIFFDDSTYLLGDILPSIEVTPETVVRTYAFNNGAMLKEVMVVSPDKPVGVIHYEYEGPEAKLGIQYKSNMRLMWPYSEQVLTTLKYGYQPGLNAIEFIAPEGEIVTFVGANKIPSSKYVAPTGMIDIQSPMGEVIAGEYKPEQDTLFEVSAGQLFELNTSDQLDILFAAGSEGRDSVATAYMIAMQDPEKIYRDAYKHYQKLQNDMLSISTPDDNFNKGYAWAVAATDRFFVTTPGLGTSIVAGYNGTDRGWDGGHKINGRPGYAWYFGRDAVWSAFAILDYGDFEGVKDILNMFVKYQDLNGKIYHELSTSGFVHYDASDATPLFIILAGRYLEQSNDENFIREIWPSIRKAYEYCLSTDTDGDYLIENTNVGHGWVEGGHLFGSHTSLYLASCWAEALWQMQMLSIVIGDDELTKKCNLQEYYVTEALNGFSNGESGYLYQGKYKDGSYHTEQSIMPATTLQFYSIILDHNEYDMLSEWSGHQYTTDWGVRMASIYNENYHPRGYHSGAVWPLYSGWVSLAEYNNGRPLQGYMHLMNNLNNYNDFALGYTEEVLNGDSYLPAGVCPHQCWSETMVLLPISTGMLGIEKDAYTNEVYLDPDIPFAWDSIKIKNLRVGKHLIDYEMKREGETTTIILSSPDQLFDISFSQLFMPGTEIKRVLLNGKKIDIDIGGEDQGSRLYFYNSEYSLNGTDEIIIHHQGGISLIPPSKKTSHGQESVGIRINHVLWKDNTYIIEAEGAPAQSYELELINNFGTPKSVTGTEGFREEGDRLFLRVEFPALNRRYTPRTIKINF
jgi:glycogen debranching enzyme